MGELRRHHIKSDFGIEDYYKHYKSIGGKVGRKTYAYIVKHFHKRIGDILASEEYNFKLPHRLGVVCVKKSRNFIAFTNGKLFTNLPVNWKDTNALWRNDSEAKEKKILIRYENYHTNRHSYKFCYIKSKAIYKNKVVYKVQINRAIKRQLANIIHEKGEIDRGTSIWNKISL
jgi:hypothetical protein